MTIFNRLYWSSARHSSTHATGRSYADALAALNSLQSNFEALKEIRKNRQTNNERAIPEMLELTRKAGYKPSDFDAFNPIHIAGTKGKGSTSAFISSILTQHAADGGLGRKVGLYTSPHLRFVRERIQINNEMLSEETFAKYFFELWDRFESAAQQEGIPPDRADTKPMYFRFLTLMAFHVFVREGVDSAVIECGIGGEYDSTNIICHPTVAAVTSLGIDHAEILGRTLPDVAWHKAGIFKRGALALVSPQPEEAMAVLKQRAAEKAVPVVVVDRHLDLDTVKLGLAGDFQKYNASLAITTAAAHLRAIGHTETPDTDAIKDAPIPPAFRRGLELVRWPGRCELRHEPRSNLAWHIDGAHTLESIGEVGRWFGSEISSSSALPQQVPRILLFNQQNRDAEALATSLHSVLSSALGRSIDTADQPPFTHVVFCTNVTFRNSGYRPDLVSLNTNSTDVHDLTVQKRLAATWKELDENAHVEVAASIEEAVERCRAIARNQPATEPVKALVTGSLHLVGGFLEVLETVKE